MRSLARLGGLLVLAGCDAAGLRPMQAELSARYDTLHTSLSREAQDSLRVGQDLWVAFWPRACDRDGGGDSLLFACVRQRFTDRLALLASTDEVALGVRTYPLSVYRVVPSSAGDPTHPLAVHESHRVGLDATVPSAREGALWEALTRWLAVEQGTASLPLDSAVDLRVLRTLRRADQPGLLLLETRRDRFDHRTGARSADTTRAAFSIDAARPVAPPDGPTTDPRGAPDRR